MKVPIAILRRLIIRIVIYIYDILIIVQTKKKALITSANLSFAAFGFSPKFKKISFEKENSWVWLQIQ